MENNDIVARTDQLVACVDNFVNPKPACDFTDPEKLRAALETAMEQAEVEIDACERRLDEVEECAAMLLHAMEALDDHIGGC